MAALVNYSEILKKYELKYLQVITEVYRQQQEMHTNKTHSTSNRIVSIHQHQVRHMVKGKARSNVEFRSKIGVSAHNGLSYLDHLNWDSYNENRRLENKFRKL